MMDDRLVPTIYQGWHDNQRALMKALAPLDAEQLSFRASSNVNSVREIAAHVIGVRARWFCFGEEVELFVPFRGWDHPKAKAWSAEEILRGLDATWTGMQEAITRWTPEEWEQTWPGEDDSEPEVVTRAWVIWHLMEHDLYHGGQISITLMAHGLPGVEI
jgi:uncharacterized damage-inducible protein DinB